MPVVSQIEDFIIAPRTMPVDPEPLSTVSVLSPGFIRLPQKECTPIDCWAEECEKCWFREPDFDGDAQPDIHEGHLVEANKAVDEQSAWKVDSATSTTMSVTTIDSPHVTCIHRNDPYEPFNPKRVLFRCPCNGCCVMRGSSYNYASMETQTSWGNTKSPQPEAQSFMAPDLHEQCFSVSHENTNAEMPYQQWNEQQQQENGRPERHSLPQVEVAAPNYVEPAAPMKFVPPPPPPVAAYEILLQEYSYGLHLGPAAAGYCTC